MVENKNILFSSFWKKNPNIFTYNYSSFGEGVVSGKGVKFAFNNIFAIIEFYLLKVAAIKESLNEQEREHDDVR